MFRTFDYSVVNNVRMYFFFLFQPVKLDEDNTFNFLSWTFPGLLLPGDNSERMFVFMHYSSVQPLH